MEIDSAIVIFGYNRPNLIEDRLKEIQSSNFENLDLRIFIDGPKDENSLQSFEIIKEILTKESKNLNFKVTYRAKNLGAAKNIVNGISEILQEKSSVIVFEDDIGISSSAVLNMDSLLKKLDTEKYATVGVFGFFPYTRFMNKIGIPNFFRSTPYFSAWGWGIRKEVWKDYRLDISKLERKSELEKSYIFRSLSKHKQKQWLRRFDRISTNVYWAWDFQMQYMSFVTNRNHLLPFFRMVDNFGFNDLRGTNTKGRRPKWYLMPHANLEKNSEMRRIRVYNNWLFKRLDSLTFIGDSPINRKNIKKILFKILGT